ncbi:MAG: phosphoribosylformylglycinamidine cyclo-ligase [Bacteroidetes bacterium]|nr:phosphoribosylformylglycinamidine cyclo-ligase [Bacteroidota bacterium]
MEDKYAQRGVSAGKEEVHAAVKDLYHGLYPKAFCKIYPDYLGNDGAYCNVMSSDGSGTKSILAYLYWKETGDISVWQGIAIDAMVMNLDDLLCIGATDNFLYTSIINRNKHLITGEVIAEIIKGGKLFMDRLKEHGVNVHLMGGETADLGDCVRTTTVDATMTVRMKQSDLVLTKNIQPGDVIIGLASYGQATYETEYNSGISSNGLTSARHDVLSKHYAETYPETFDAVVDSKLVYSGSKRMTDKLEGTPLNIGQALLSPTRTYTPVIKKLLSTIPDQVHGLVNCTGGAHTKVLHYIENLRIVKDNLLPVPPIFQLIQQESNTDWKEMYKVLNCGTRLEVYVKPEHAQQVIDVAQSFGIAAQVIGHVEAADKNEVIVKSEHGEFTYN